jgi:hypothetical protein
MSLLDTIINSKGKNLVRKFSATNVPNQQAYIKPHTDPESKLKHATLLK